MNKNDKGDNQIKLLDDILQLQDDSLMEPQDNDAKSCSSIPLPMVSGKELVSIAEFFRLCERLKKENSSEEVVKRQKSAFANKFDVDSLIALTIAANYINYDGLMDCTCERIANLIRGKTQMRFEKCLTLTMIFHLRKTARSARITNGSLLRNRNP